MSLAKDTKETTLLATRIGEIAKKWWPYGSKKLLLIRPKIPGDTYTVTGSNVWAEQVKQKAVAEGWTVTDLDANDATREKIEEALTDVKPNLVIHYDHGSSFTLWGQESDALEPGIDEDNVDKAAGRIMSTVSCQSASGLGPTAISDGVTSYLGYTENHTFVIGYETQFGDASNAANFALLECKTVQAAYDIGWTAYDDLYNSLIASGDTFAAMWALHDRDCWTMLGSGTARACSVLLCKSGLPYMVCKAGVPVMHCKTGLPDSSFHCVKGLPDSAVSCNYGLPQIIECGSGNPLLDVCGRGPDSCMAGPPLRIREIYNDYPEDILIVDMKKVPSSMRKSFEAMIDKMNSEKF